MSQTQTHPGTDRGFAAVFVDLENLYYELKRMAPDREVIDYILTVIRKIGGKLEQSVMTTPIILKAYADFEQMGTTSQGSLYLMGVETHNVMGTDHKNAADMRLCIDALEVLYTRPEIQTFVLVAGDRDYIPLVQHLRRQGRRVFVSSFRSNLSGDLLQNIDKGNYIDALELLSEEERRAIEISRLQAESVHNSAARGQRKIAWQPIQQAGAVSSPVAPIGSTLYSPAIPRHSGSAASVAAGVASSAASGVVAATIASEQPKIATNGNGADKLHTSRPQKEGFEDPKPITDESSRKALQVMLEHFGQHKEVWMSPLLWKLSNAMPLLADFERKLLLANLQSLGAIDIVKRKGELHDYSAVIINYNHPTVRECIP